MQRTNNGYIKFFIWQAKKLLSQSIFNQGFVRHIPSFYILFFIDVFLHPESIVLILHNEYALKKRVGISCLYFYFLGGNKLSSAKICEPSENETLILSEIYLPVLSNIWDFIFMSIRSIHAISALEFSNLSAIIRVVERLFCHFYWTIPKISQQKQLKI